MILGINYSKIYSEPVFTFESGCTLYKTMLLQSNAGINGCLACPIDIFETETASSVQPIMKIKKEC